MVFSSSQFLFVFFPLFFLLYLALPRARNVTLLLASLLFYFVGEGVFVLVMFFSILINYVFGRVLSNPDYKKLALIVGITLNLLMLIYFKYFTFLIADVFNMPLPNWAEAIHLPIGISFFTFQGISYLIDVYREDAEPEKSLLNLATYIAMFPQLIAGPIVRYADVANSIKAREISSKKLYFGVIFFCMGLSSKVLLADTVASVADKIYALSPETLHASAAFLAGITYFFQIFFDFSGYSAMAIGIGLMIGFKFPQNFNFPYISQSITEFWRRWHISLSSWFRDYLYIPLGGNRHGALRTYRNLAIIFVTTGVWHGSSWNFIIWGLWHGLFICLERVGVSDFLKKIWVGFRVMYCLMIVYVGWILFRAEDLGHAISMMKQHFDFEGEVKASQFLTNELCFTLVLCVVASTPILMRLFQKFSIQADYGAWDLEHSKLKYNLGLFFALLLFCLSVVKILSGSYSPFIYFRF